MQIPLEIVGGLVCSVRPEEQPEGSSPRNWDVDYAVGRWYQRPGLGSVFAYGNSSVGPNPGGAAANVAVTGSAWQNPANILLGDGSYAVCGQAAGNSITGGSDALQVTQFAFDVPAAQPLTGIAVKGKGFSNTATTLTAQLILDGAPIGETRSVALPSGNSAFTLGDISDMWGLSAPSVNNTTFGVQFTVASGFGLASAYLDFATLTLFQTGSTANFNFIQTFKADDGMVINLAVDADGAWWMENVSENPGVLTLVMEGLTPGSYASSCTVDDGEFICFSDLSTGSDLPRKFTINPQTIDRVSQVGPGAPPVFTPSSASATTYPIVDITQPAQQVRTSSYFLQSNGPGSNTPGNVVTVYYSDSTLSGADNDLVTAFNSGNATYVFTEFDGGPVTQGPVTAQVTSVGLGAPPGQPRQFYYFTYIVPTSAYIYYAGSGHPGYTAKYQRTLATLTTSVPVPQLTVGDSAVVTGNSVTPWNATWPITQTLNSGSMAITQTSLTAGVATYSYLVLSGANPVAGELVRVTNTLNANGALNVVNVAIDSVTGTNIGTFTVTGLPAGTDYPAEAEDGQATTAGTEFAFEPALLTLGTATSPIYGSGTGGQLVISATESGNFIAPGIKQGVLFFITENGFETPPSPFVQFTVPENTTAINASQILIGPPNVKKRGIAFTESGTNGQPGENFFTIPNPVKYTVQGVEYTATALIIDDNTSTSATFSFLDATLQAATAIDVQGNNLFNLIEIGNPAWVTSYASRNIYGLAQNKIQNFLNLSFDGGYLPGVQLTPSGWTVPDQYGQLLVSPLFGNSYYIKNSTGGALSVAGLISQSAYQDAYLVPIITAGETYSIRVCARAPAKKSGNLVIDLVANGVTYGSYIQAFVSMTDNFVIYNGTLLTSAFATVPDGLQLRIYATDMEAGADVELDRIEIAPTSRPVNQVAPLVSYAGNPESVDAITGRLDTSSENSQPCYGGAVVLEQLVLLKEHSIYQTQDSPNYEPGGDPGWNLQPLSQKIGTSGVNTFDYGDDWLLTMERAGVFGFNGGRLTPIARELQLMNGPNPSQKKGLWESINWQAEKSFWLRNDIDNCRFYCGVALPTPNFWLPNAPASNPTQPNVILMCNYEGCATFDELIAAAPVHTTIMGTLKALEQKRKWSIWQIPSPYAAMVRQSTGAELTMLFCNGIASGKIYELVPQQPNDDGVPVYPLYVSYGFDGNKQSTANAMGPGRKLSKYWTANVQGNGLAGLRFYPNTLTATMPQTNPLALRLQPNPQNDDERKVEVAGERIFIEISGQGGYVECARQTLDMVPHPWNVKRGIAL